MNILLLNVIVRTIPKIDANNFEDSRLIVKPRKKWLEDFVNDILIFVSSLIAVVLTDKLPIPYIGTFFFIGGFYGIFHGLIFGIRAFLIYKAYYQIFNEDDIKKLEEIR